MGYTKSRIIINGVVYTISDDSAIKYDRQMDIADSFKAQARANIGLGNVDNTSDANKPISTAQAAALALKAENADTPLKSDIAIIVNGDSTSTPVPVGGYAYIKNNTHGLSDGLYYNKSTAPYTSGMTANGIVFGPVSGGGLNAVNIDKSCTLIGTTSSLGDITLTEPFRNYYFLYVVSGGYGYQVVKLFPVDALEASQVFMIAGGYENDAYSYRIAINSDGVTLRLESKGSAITSPVKVYGIWHK